MRLGFQSTLLLLLASAVHGQDRGLAFAWPEQAAFVVSCRHQQDQRTFTVRSEFTISPGPPPTAGSPSTRVVSRRTATISLWNGRAVPASARAKLAPLELGLLFVPDVLIRADGTLFAVEDREAFVARCRGLRDALVAGDAVDAEAADDMLAKVAERPRYELLSVRVQDTWDDWVTRWLDLEFGERADAEFDGEVEIATGDVVDGEFHAQHLGPVDGDQDAVRLRIEFTASGPRLDAAALAWRQRLFEGDDQPFERVSLEVDESRETVTDPLTMQPRTVETKRTMRVIIGGETKEYVEGRRWSFEW